MASSIDLRQLDPCSASAEHVDMQLACTRAAISNAAGRSRCANAELATRHSIGETARLSRAGSVV